MNALTMASIASQLSLCSTVPVALQYSGLIKPRSQAQKTLDILPANLSNEQLESMKMSEDTDNIAEDKVPDAANIAEDQVPDAANITEDQVPDAANIRNPEAPDGEQEARQGRLGPLATLGTQLAPSILGLVGGALNGLGQSRGGLGLMPGFSSLPRRDRPHGGHRRPYRKKPFYQKYQAQDYSRSYEGEDEYDYSDY